VLRGDEIIRLFEGREAAILETVRRAYEIKEQGDSSCPNCPFLRFPDKTKDRIIPKPAFVGGSIQAAGIKWIASFPDNAKAGMDRASATLILNSPQTGHPEAIMEGSVISACRTAASAALAASVLRDGNPVGSAGFLGCGPINFETLRFLLSARPEIERLFLYDTNPARTRIFREKCNDIAEGRQVTVVDSAAVLFARSDVAGVATNAIVPHLDRLEGCPDGAVILHISLRDFAPRVILDVENVVDDVDQVCSNRTSLDLAAQQAGHRNFIRATLGGILLGAKPRESGHPVIFSPFGLGVLDIALARLTLDLAKDSETGMALDGFLPTPWVERSYALSTAENPLYR
jgi:2,3-diaminopropionate biosynthesis protein SbnB